MHVHTAINLVHCFITDNHFKTKYSSIILLESFCQGIEILSVSCTYFGNHFYTNDWLYLLIQNSAYYNIINHEGHKGYVVVT